MDPNDQDYAGPTLSMIINPQSSHALYFFIEVTAYLIISLWRKMIKVRLFEIS